MKVTVFTPTYNRAYILPVLYKSLQMQSCMDFEWLVIDDGSTDNTVELLKEWGNQEKMFNIRVFRQENSGKCSAINRALDLARGDYFFVMDSDDWLTPDAIFKVIGWFESLPTDKKYCGIVGNKGYSATYTPNWLFSNSYIDKPFTARYYYLEQEQPVLDGERAIVLYTSIAKQYKYPVFNGEKFMTEAVVWNRMAKDGYIARFFNDIICIYEYLDDGLTSAGHSLFLDNPRGYGLWIKEKQEILNPGHINRIKSIYSFTADFYGSKIEYKTLADALSAPIYMIWLAGIINKIRYSFRKRENNEK